MHCIDLYLLIYFCIHIIAASNAINSSASISRSEELCHNDPIVSQRKSDRTQKRVVTVQVKVAFSELYQIIVNDKQSCNNLTKSINSIKVNHVEVFISGPEIESMILQLERSHVTIADGLIVWHHDIKTSLKEISDLDFNNCQFAGSVLEHTSSFATINLCGGVSGEIELTNTIATLNTVKSGDTIQHVLRMKPSYANNEAAFPTNTSNIEVSHHGELSKKRIMRREAVDQNLSLRYIELHVILDHSMYQKLNTSLEDCMRRTLNIIAHANFYFSQFMMNIRLVGMEVWSTRNRIPYPREGRSSDTFDADSIMTRFNTYRYQNNWTHASDAAVLITNEKLSIPVRVVKNSICSLLRGGMLISDYLNSIRYTAILLSHGLGLLLGLNHINAFTGCDCSPGTECIMSNTLGPYLLTKEWSGCTKVQLRENFKIYNFGRCLGSIQVSLYQKEAICGDYTVDEGEDCDCGPTNRCTSRCCDPQTCKFYTNATCATGACCEMDTCTIKRKGAICRPSNDEICDVEERCDGTSEWCPADNHQPNGIKCVNNGDAYCYGGRCRSHTSQCQYIYGRKAKSAKRICYEAKNWKGTIDGNCGRTDAGGYKACQSQVEAFCGVLYCRGLTGNLTILEPKGVMLSNTTTYIYGNECSQVSYHIGDTGEDVGHVPNGARCGRNQMCVNSKCVRFTFPRTKSTTTTTTTTTTSTTTTSTTTIPTTTTPTTTAPTTTTPTTTTSTTTTPTKTTTTTTPTTTTSTTTTPTTTAPTTTTTTPTTTTPTTTTTTSTTTTPTTTTTTPTTTTTTPITTTSTITTTTPTTTTTAPITTTPTIITTTPTTTLTTLTTTTSSNPTTTTQNTTNTTSTTTSPVTSATYKEATTSTVRSTTCKPLLTPASAKKDATHIYVISITVATMITTSVLIILLIHQMLKNKDSITNITKTTLSSEE